jgi:predicted PurR-regulated permease PerM
MQFDSETFRRLLSKDVTDFLIRIGLVAILVVLSLQIITPFANLLLWGLILAVSLFPLHQRLVKFLRGRQGLAATVLVIVGLVIIGAPTIMLGESFADQVQRANTAFENDDINIKAPNASVAEWPLIGKRVHSAWTAAAEDLPTFLTEHKLQLKKISKGALSAAASTAAAIFLFLGSLVIAGIMMAYAESGGRVVLRILSRLTDPVKGSQLQGLSVATIRSVATGVVGVAFIQGLLLGVGFVIGGIPAAGILAFLVVLIGILQIPALIISLPAIAYLWWAGDASTTANILLTIYLLVAGMADNFLKPLLLGRGVDVPMPVVLLGALGGMVSAGIIGLFVGAVVLSVAYEIFMVWVDGSEEVAPKQEG